MRVASPSSASIVEAISSPTPNSRHQCLAAGLVVGDLALAPW